MLSPLSRACVALRRFRPRCTCWSWPSPSCSAPRVTWSWPSSRRMQNGVQGARHPRHVLELRTRPRLLFKQLPNFLGNIEFNGALLSVVVDSPTQPPRQLRRNSSSSASVGSIHLCVHEPVITHDIHKGRRRSYASKSSMLKPSSTARCSSVSSSTARTLLRGRRGFGGAFFLFCFM